MDRTGPAGMGPRTGRGFGPCMPGLGWQNRFGSGRGPGRCFGWSWPQTQKEQLGALKEYQKAIKEELEDVEKELGELQKEPQVEK